MKLVIELLPNFDSSNSFTEEFVVPGGLEEKRAKYAVWSKVGEYASSQMLRYMEEERETPEHEHQPPATSGPGFDSGEGE